METLRTYLSTLSPPQQAQYAARARTSIGYLRKALSKGQRFDGGLVRLLHVESGGAVSLHELRPDIWPEPDDVGQTLREAVGALVDSRMSKRALRAKFGFKTDAPLAKLLKLPVEQVEAWPEEQSVPALPQVLRLLGVQETPPAAQDVPHDPDADRIDLEVHAA